MLKGHRNWDLNRAMSQQSVLPGSKSGDVFLQHKGTEQAHAGSNTCLWHTQKVWHLRYNLKPDASPESVWTSHFEYKASQQ